MTEHSKKVHQSVDGMNGSIKCLTSNQEAAPSGPVKPNINLYNYLPIYVIVFTE